jgi:hypothetical protein
MLASIWSLLGWQEEQVPSPPAVTITGVRIPADGTPAHLVSLTTTSVSGNTDAFLFHSPDLRQYWKTKRAWQFRDLQRIDLENQGRSSCNGIYYAFYSFAIDDLPENTFVPDWMRNRHNYWGDVFLVKMAPHEYGQYGWAAYEDISPDFLQLLAEGPTYGRSPFGRGLRA